VIQIDDRPIQIDFSEGRLTMGRDGKITLTINGDTLLDAVGLVDGKIDLVDDGAQIDFVPSSDDLRRLVGCAVGALTARHG
jgi:hypothetical protein